MPIENVPFTPTVAAPSLAVRDVVHTISLQVNALSATVDASGGIGTKDLFDVLQPTMDRLGFRSTAASTFAPSALRVVATERRVALAVHGGRAHTNNAALESVLAAAAHRDVDWLVIVLPERYKSNATFTKVSAQLNALRTASGIRLDLVGVTLVGFRSAS
ncbi:hypothetical protein ACFT5B_17940 [Luteimicrobium sp. NPDC057192]|uniref:hypothetical protein n=1 Tax=Luteimicrobium sp. NPDC057192 TaxID=3346042 RepID=UPI003632F06C